jgi:hypothetical protein
MRQGRAVLGQVADILIGVELDLQTLEVCESHSDVKVAEALCGPGAGAPVHLPLGG